MLKIVSFFGINQKRTLDSQTYLINSTKKCLKAYSHAAICRPREIVKQIGACKWRPDARAISVRHVGRFGKNLWSLHRFSRVGADFTAQAYVSLRKMADVESKPARKKRSFDEKEINLLISQWSEYPCLFDKTNPDHKDQNKRADLLQDFSGPTNRHDKSQRVNRPNVVLGRFNQS